MTLLTAKEVAVRYRFKNYKSLYNNKTIPRVRMGGKLLFVQETLDEMIEQQTSGSFDRPSKRLYRIKVRP